MIKIKIQSCTTLIFSFIYKIRIFLVFYIIFGLTLKFCWQTSSQSIKDKWKQLAIQTKDL